MGALSLGFRDHLCAVQVRQAEPTGLDGDLGELAFVLNSTTAHLERCALGNDRRDLHAKTVIAILGVSFETMQSRILLARA